MVKEIYEILSNIKRFKEALQKYAGVFQNPKVEKMVQWCEKKPLFVKEEAVRKIMIEEQENFLKMLDIIKEEMNLIEF